MAGRTRARTHSRYLTCAITALLVTGVPVPAHLLAQAQAQRPASSQATPPGAARPGVVAPRAQATPPRDPRARPTTGTGVVRGRVLDEDGAPLANARVRTSFGPNATRVAVTDGSGRYELSGLPAVGFSVTARRNGYSGRPGQSSRSVTLADGEVRDHVDLVLVKAGVIVGRVFGPDGEPLVGARVAALSARRTPIGRQLAQSVGPDTTDDLGAFRLHSLAPGRYFVAVHPNTWGPDSLDGSGAPEGLAPAFYPGTTDMASARAVVVASGAETTVDMTVPISPLFTITGTVVDVDGTPLRQALVNLQSRRPEGDALGGYRSSWNQDGTFRLERVPPGTYTLVARASFRAEGERRRREGPQPRGETEVYVAGDVHGVVIRLTNGATVRGRVVFASPPPVDQTAVMVRPTSLTPYGGGEIRPAALAADGTFELTGLRGTVTFMVTGGHVPGDPAVSISLGVVAGTGAASGQAGSTGPGGVVAVPGGVPGGVVGSIPGGMEGRDARPLSIVSSGGGWRVRAIRVSGRDVTDEGVDVGQGGEVSGVEIEVARDYAMVTGVVRDARGEPLEGATILALATDDRTAKEREGAIRVRGRSMRDGQYVSVGLAPGTWDLVAVPEGEPLDPFDDDPRVLEALRSRAVRVTLGESQRMTLDLRVLTQ
ncbi:MAG: carboxypeptidase regulatory-like domain-containing protein [Vicinamibacteraceae bacterium]|nr:carboxypeptidase regulatory-like domain-containing protein [Vicinamibacteraceae bacterium]